MTVILQISDKLIVDSDKACDFHNRSVDSFGESGMFSVLHRYTNNK